MGTAGRRTAVLLAAVLAADVLALRLLAPPAPRPVDDVVQEFRAAAPQQSAASSAPPAPSPRPTDVPRARRPQAPAARVARTVAPPMPGTERPPAAPDGAAPAAPQPGVYVYATSGGEQVELLGTDRHEYPPTTAVTVRRTPCGVTSVWEPVEGRREQRSECLGDRGLDLREVRSVHRFLRVTDERRFRCPPGAVVVPDRPVAGSTSSGRCTGEGGDTLTFTTTVVAVGQRERVGDRIVEVVRVRQTGLLDAGEEAGRSVDERWTTPGGLLVRQRVVTEGTTPTPLGTARYRESFELRLTSLQPQR